MMVPFMFIKFHILSTSLLDSDQVGWDGGYGSYLAMLKYHFDNSNPIRSGFLQAIAPDGDRLYGKEPSKDAPETVLQTRKQRTRNRLWVAYMMSKNPELKDEPNPAFQRKTDAKQRRPLADGTRRMMRAP